MHSLIYAYLLLGFIPPTYSYNIGYALYSGIYRFPTYLYRSYYYIW